MREQVFLYNNSSIHIMREKLPAAPNVQVSDTRGDAQRFIAWEIKKIILLCFRKHWCGTQIFYN